MTALRMFVFGLLLLNVVLLAVRSLQPGAIQEVTEDRMESSPMPYIEQIKDLPPNDALVELETPAEIREESKAMAVPDSRECVRLGPFGSENEMAALQSELRILAGRVQTRELELMVEKGYWVHIPPYATRTEAQQAVKKLSAAGAKDFYIVPRGYSANAVALGIFKSRASAEKRREQLAGLGLGLEIVIELETETESQYWLESGPVDAANPALNQLAFNYPGLQQLQISCPDAPPESQRAVNDGDSPPESTPLVDNVPGN